MVSFIWAKRLLNGGLLNVCLLHAPSELGVSLGIAILQQGDGVHVRTRRPLVVGGESDTLRGGLPRLR